MEPINQGEYINKEELLKAIEELYTIRCGEYAQDYMIIDFGDVIEIRTKVISQAVYIKKNDLIEALGGLSRT